MHFFPLHLCLWLITAIIYSRISGWPFELVSHFIVTWLLLALGLVWAAVRQHKKGWIWSALGLTLVLGIKLWAMQSAYPVASSKEKPESSITLSQWNVMSRNDLVLHWIEKHPDVDIVVLNEVKPWMLEELTEGLPAYPYKVLPEGKRPDTMLLSRLPLENVRITPIDGSPRFLLSAEAKKDGKRFVIMALHTTSPRNPSRYARRAKELAAVATAVRAQSLAVVVAGDLNITAYSPDFAAFMEASRLALSTSPLTLPVTWPSFLPLPGLGISIDHVLVSKGIAVLDRSAEYLVCCSDHAPVITRFAVHP